MSAGATLLKLQQIDLELARNKSELANMPELKELASKRKTYVKLKSEMTKLYAQRKDLDIELDDLNTTEIQTNNAIEAAKKEARAKEVKWWLKAGAAALAGYLAGKKL